MKPSQNNNPDYVEFVAASSRVASEYEKDKDDPWATSPFRWIMTLPSRRKGAAGEKLVAEWASSRGFSVKRSPSTDADRLINGHRIEIKMSTLWASGGFKFQQIRDQEYDFCLCLGLMPQDVRAWLLPKAVLHEYVINHTPQHAGSAGSDTFWLSFNADTPPDWMEDYGGTLTEVAEMFHNVGQGPY